ncbi:reverse transcriptase domain-containing protein [Tanacetum coccineum]
MLPFRCVVPIFGGVTFDKLPKESIDSYEDLRTAFRENYLQQTKHIKDPVEIHHIKQRDGESTKDFMDRYKAEVLDVEGAPECMRISEFMHGITHPGLIKRLYERIPRSMDEMYRMTTSFLQGEVAALSHGQRKASSSWKPSEGGINQILRKASKTNKDRIIRLEKKAMVWWAAEYGRSLKLMVILGFPCCGVTKFENNGDLRNLSLQVEAAIVKPGALHKILNLVQSLNEVLSNPVRGHLIDDFVSFLLTSMGDMEVSDRILSLLSNVVSTPDD